MRPFKFIVQAVLLDEADSMIVGERATDPVVLYGDTLAAVAADFDSKLTETLEQQNA